MERLLAVKHYQHQRVIVKSDSKLLINSVNGVCETPWKIKMLVKDIKAISTVFLSIHFRHVYREANLVTYVITELGHDVYNVVIWSNCLPFFAFPAFHLD